MAATGLSSSASASGPRTQPKHLSWALVTSPNAIRMNLLVLYTLRLDECRAFYAALGLTFTAEQHGQGPKHYAAIFEGGTVFELYPARPGRPPTDALRLGLAVAGKAATPELAPGRHLRTDPDCRTIEIHAT